MGAIGEEELIKWENMQVSPSTCEEKILVCVRLRPLNEKEIARNEVSDWECINETTILYRNSLPERSMFPTVSTFDRVFSGECSTRKLYEEGTKEIALSVVSGINSSIFAYGQTSSGKTYTMIGITEYAVVDIYDYIQKHEERSFVLKFSAMEIYNEAVRDLLSTDTTPLRVLDDPEKGTIVEKLTEETLRDWDHLKELLSICEAQRQVGETPLNETSSRSHQILRLTIESCAREFLGKDNSTTLAASVNFVDLAGSERASQALSVGARLKEGCHINRSLLTLGTVIRKLSKGRHGHINYRDSKLTRILQPCLGGNARTAIICTLSPARSHAEQSRNTLLFASCAKEVTTNAQVNVVMSDKVLVKHLQSELARLESEIRTPVPTSNCDYAALLRKKNLHIEKLEKEVRELTKQRDLAESRVEDLVQLVKIDQASRHGDQSSNHLSCQESDTWGEDSSVSESSGVANPQCPDIGVRKSKGTQTSKKDHRSSTHGVYPEDPRDICREVRCIEMDERDNDKISESVALPTNENERSVALRVPRNENVTDDKMASTPSRKVKHNNQNDSTYGVLKQKFRDVQKTIDSLVSPYPEEPSHWALEADMSYPRSFKLTSSRSCRDDLITGSSSPYSEMERQSQKTPPYGFEKSFPGRPEGFLRMLPALSFGANIARLSTSDSQSSFGSAFGDGLKAQSDKASADEENPSIDAFFAGLKEMTKLQYKKQPVDDQVQGTEPKAEESGKEINNVGLDPVQDSLEAPHSWPIEFERQQKMIIELWQTCNISLVHRTYFFLLFNGDPADSIYMEVELRRLSFLKESLSQRNRAVEDSRTLTLASSLKALRREREMLSRLMSKSFSEVERIRLYQKWGISLDSNRRKMQLVQHLWNNTKDMNHIMESASIVAKLIKFSEQVQALKEMFGLSFIPPSMNRRSFGRNRSVLSIL